jgi:hypothetical protein
VKLIMVLVNFQREILGTSTTNNEIFHIILETNVESWWHKVSNELYETME